MTEDEKWAAMRKTALSDHEPFCNYGQTNGREMCTCQVLVDLVEGTDDEPEPTFDEALRAAYEGPIRDTPAAHAERVAAGDDPEPAGAGPQRGGGQSSSDARKARLDRLRADKAKAKRA